MSALKSGEIRSVLLDMLRFAARIGCDLQGGSAATKASARGSQTSEPPTDLEQQLETCRRELAEAREPQAAISEVLPIAKRHLQDAR